jgi:hypothetical protein
MSLEDAKMSEKSKSRRAVTIALASAGGLSALMANVQFNRDEGVLFGKGLSFGLSQAEASSCDKNDKGETVCGCSQGCGVR